MKFSWFLALRYLKPKRTFISIITVISVLGVALGVGVLIVVIAVMSGFEKRIKDEWLTVESPLYLKNLDRGWLDPDRDKEAQEKIWQTLLPQIKSFPGVKEAAPYLEVQSMVQRARKRMHDQNSVTVDPANLPPDEEEEPEMPEEGTPPEESPPPKALPQSPEPPEPTPAPQPVEPAGDTPAPEPDAKPPAPTPEEMAAANAAAEETGLDRRNPLAPALIRGVDMDDPNAVERYSRRFRELLARKSKRDGKPAPQAYGEFDLAGDTIVLSQDLADKISVGMPMPVQESFISVFGPYFINEGFDMLEENRQAKDDPALKAKLDAANRNYPMPEELRFTGVFNDDKMQGVGFVSLKTAQRLAGAGLDVDGFAIDIADPYDAPAMAKKLMAGLKFPEGGRWGMETWIDRHRQQFDAVANERGMMYIVLAFISIVAAFCIMNTMITMAVMKRREIGMMRALGAKVSHIVGLFMTNGFIVGLAGTGLGYIIGRTVLHYRNGLREWINNTFGHQIFSSEIYGLWEIPADLRTVDQVIICGLAFILCTLAAVPPALIVGRMQPAQALRSDR